MPRAEQPNIVLVATELSSFSDEQLAEQSQRGALVAFEQLVYRYEHRVYAFVYRWCRHEADAREVTQDVFVKAFQGLGRYDTRRAFAPWLFCIARRTCVDFHRGAKPGETGKPIDCLELKDPHELLAQDEERRQLWEFAGRVLPRDQAQALWFRYAEDMNVKQIAQVLCRTQVHVRVLLFRARQTLARELEPARVDDIPNSQLNPRSLSLGLGGRKSSA